MAKHTAGVKRNLVKEDLMLADPIEANKAQIKAVYLDKDNASSFPAYGIGPAGDLRRRILSVSLFPNLYNRKYMIHEME